MLNPRLYLYLKICLLQISMLPKQIKILTENHAVFGCENDLNFIME